jgi:hypothetical protein
MTKKALLVMTMVGCLVAWSSLALADSVTSLQPVDYTVYAAAEAPGGSSSPGEKYGLGSAAVSAIFNGAQASAKGPDGSYHLYCNASVSGSGRYAESYGSGQICFKAPAEAVTLSFDWAMESSTAGTAAATAWLVAFFDDYSHPQQTLFSESVDASSEAGVPGNLSDFRSKSDNFNQTFDSLVIGNDYCFDLQAYWLYADSQEASAACSASALAWIGNVQLTYENGVVDPPVVDPPAVPVPGTLLLLSSGLLGLVGWRRMGKN